MPCLIWLVLVVFMLVMIVAGLAYAALHLWRAFGKVSRTGAAIGEHMAAFQNTAPSDGQPEPPLFTQPLSVASERYSQAHAEVIRRREAKRSRHVEAWARWRRFNND